MSIVPAVRQLSAMLLEDQYQYTEEEETGMAVAPALSFMMMA
jgi:hypothetical protein